MNHQPAKSQADLAKHVKEFLTHGLTLQFMGGMTPQRMYIAYEHAKALFYRGDFGNALDILKFLCLQDHTNKAYFLYLGACYHRTNRHEMAIKAYTHASVLDFSDPRPHFNAAICYLTLNNLPAAEHAAADAQQCSESEIWRGDLQVRIKSLRMAIDTKRHRAA